MDILDSNVNFPDTIYIVATGTEEDSVYSIIPDDAFVIVVNGAIDIPLPVKPALWMISDPQAATRDYCTDNIEDVIKQARGSDRISPGKFTQPLFENSIAVKFPGIKYTFKLAPNVSCAFTPETCFRNGATISGIAVQLAYLKGCKRVYLIGISFYGAEYWDGNESDNPDKKNSAWNFHKNYWDWMIHVLTTTGEFNIYNLRDAESRPTIAGRYRKKAKEKIRKQIVRVEQKLPTVGYLCMAYDPVDTRHAIHDFYYQDYPHELKTLYLLYQRDSANEFPVEIETNIPELNLVQVKVDGMFPELWLFKLMAYLENSKEDYTLWWDEDDCYPENYTAEALEPILKNESKVAWNYSCIIMKRHTFNLDKYNSPIGTMIIETELLRGFAQNLWHIAYEGTWQSPKRLPRIDYRGAKDNQLRRMIENKIGYVPSHKAIRSYLFHSQADTIGDRKAEEDADYQSGRARKKKWREAFIENEKRKAQFGDQ